MTDEGEVRFQPDDRCAPAPAESTVLTAAEMAGIPLEHLCGGNGLCGTCAVDIAGGSDLVTPPTEAERELLTTDELDAGRRLACRCRVSQPGDIEVTVPPASRTDGELVLTDGEELDVDLDPAVTQHRVTMSAPSLADTTADRERLFDALAEGYDLAVATIDHRAQARLPATLRAADDGGQIEVTATVYAGREVLDVTPGSGRACYGLAIDVGTTTLAVYLVDLVTGEEAAVSAGLNPQSAYGEDLMSRMRHCRRVDDGREQLQQAVIDGINEHIEAVLTDAAVERDRVYEAVLVGNTAMHHLLLGYDPTHVAGSPYVPARHASVTVPAETLGIEINPAGYLHWLPVSGGWVGPDKVAVLLASGHIGGDETTVCIDIGTNGEISVATPDRVLTTSAPAGPALEGGELTCGVRARTGAIDAVSVDPDTFEPTIGTIDDAPPVGVCGSGVIDAIAACFIAGVVDRRGTITDDAAASDWVHTIEDGELAYVLADGQTSQTGEPVLLTQNDIRDVQMAKAAIQAGTNVLLEELGQPAVDRVVVAGGFGNHIAVQSAIDIGLYPDVPPSAVTTLGNGAGTGAKWALVDTAARDEADDIIEATTYHEIAGTDVFETHFLEAMYLPHQRFETCPRVKDRIESRRSTIEVEQARGVRS